MPLYEYECSACKNRFEIRQRVADEPVSVCPTCGGSVRRVLHPVGIIFKGSGFYVTDNRKSEAASTSTAPSEKSSSEKASTEKSTSSGESSAPAAPAATPAASSSDGGKKAPASTTKSES